MPSVAPTPAPTEECPTCARIVAEWSEDALNALLADVMDIPDDDESDPWEAIEAAMEAEA